jgi:hypothetical protein
MFPVLTLQALLFRIFGQLRIEVAVFTGEEPIHRFGWGAQCRTVVFPLRPGSTRRIRWRIRLSSIVEANQMNNGVAGIESARQQVLKRAIVGRKVSLFDRVRAERQHRLLGNLPITAKVRARCRDEHFLARAHDVSMLCKALGEANKIVAMQLTTFPSKGVFAYPRKKVQSRIPSRLENDPLRLLSVFIDNMHVDEVQIDGGSTEAVITGNVENPGKRHEWLRRSCLWRQKVVPCRMGTPKFLCDEGSVVLPFDTAEDFRAARFCESQNGFGRQLL